jgi:hypothetical protein
MKPFNLVLSGLLLSSALAFGQQAASPSSAGATATPANDGVAQSDNRSSLSTTIVRAEACPVLMHAKQAGATDLIKVQRGPDARPETPENLSKPGQRIHLMLSGLPATGKIIGATVTARGLSGRGHIDNAIATRASGTSDLRRTFDVKFTVQDDKSLSAELVLPGFTTVKSIKLEALQFADGSSRDFSGQQLCTVAPDPLLLVAGN